MKSIKTLALVFVTGLLSLALVACTTAPEAPVIKAGEFKAMPVMVNSRGIAVPAILTVPTGVENTPLVVMAHGHGGSKEEAGGFTTIAEALAKKGIASIRMDFPGCGQSVEPFTQNNLTHMLADIEASRLYALANASIDTKRIGIFGYSMGGRLAILATETTSYAALGLLAPVATDGPNAMYSFMGGKDGYAALAAKAASEGHVIFTTPFGQIQDLDKKWFDDNASAKCIYAIAFYEGPIIYIRGSDDIIIAESVINASAAAANRSLSVDLVTIAGADHGYGFYGGDPRLKTETVAIVTEFFERTLF